MKSLIKMGLMLIVITFTGCTQRVLTPDEINHIRATSRVIQNEDRQNRREYLQDRKQYELNNESSERIYIIR